MKILVSGAKGYIGSEVMFRLKLMGLNPIGVDLGDKLEEADVIIHLATDLSGSGADFIVDEMVLAQEVCSLTDKVVFTSSEGVYGNVSKPSKETDPLNPISDYGRSKVAVEEVIQKSGIDYTILRLANVYSKDAIHGFISNLLKGENILYDGGKKLRDYIHLSDVVSVLIEATLTNKWKGIYNIGTGKSVSSLDIFNRLSNKKPKMEHRKEIDTALFDVNKARKNGFDPFTL